MNPPDEGFTADNFIGAHIAFWLYVHLKLAFCQSMSHLVNNFLFLNQRASQMIVINGRTFQVVSLYRVERKDRPVTHPADWEVHIINMI
ncbi:hypothetical protein SDC9_153024 [bioreactor metagenome]|uniref:Uncharacterized protein n=1 Tax=bioreactor metagenome TaxID=1076179 RepID=A0A645EUR8_9ZZZZ